MNALGFSKATPNSDGTWSAGNGYHYNTQWSGVPPTHFASRGAGVPYLTGLIRPCEIAQGQINHATFGNVVGDDAVYKTMTWNDGSFAIDFTQSSTQQTTTRSTQGLLMEGMLFRRLMNWLEGRPLVRQVKG